MRSMTAYAQVYKRKNSQSVQIVFRSLNYKYLDVFIHNLPAENIFLEEKIKKEIKQKISRGRIEVFIFLKRPVSGQLHIDEQSLARYLTQLKKIAKKYHLRDDISARDILSFPKVVYWQEKAHATESLILPAVKSGVRKLVEFKERGGRSIEKEMAKCLRGLKENARRIKMVAPHPVRSLENNKEDISEEVALISFYIKKLEKVITASKMYPKGKPIDFLTQEILRELNAASSKAKHRQIVSLIVEAKNHLERIREQAQNIE